MKNKTILITGAAGSIGSALARRIYQLQPKKLLLLDQDETGIFNLEEELKGAHGIIANIRDSEAILDVFFSHRPNIVFHCAAMKHVVMCERYPSECQKTNLIGLVNIVDKAVAYKTEKFVFISSDKAVNPKCQMGISKQNGEDFCLSCNTEKGTKFIITRFGNVMASRGSVIPIWQKQIKENKDLTVTSKNMERYFMGIYEAVDLVIQASQIGKGGEIFVLDMGKPYKIDELANLMIKLSGKPLGIKYTQVGQGEKFSEELMTNEEKKRAIKKNNLFIIYDKSKKA